MGLRLSTSPHHRLAGSNRFLLRVGDYRVIYALDTANNVIHLLAIGHRRAGTGSKSTAGASEGAREEKALLWGLSVSTRRRGVSERLRRVADESRVTQAVRRVSAPGTAPGSDSCFSASPRKILHRLDAQPATSNYWVNDGACDPLSLS